MDGPDSEIKLCSSCGKPIAWEKGATGANVRVGKHCRTCAPKTIEQLEAENKRMRNWLKQTQTSTGYQGLDFETLAEIKQFLESEA